MRSVGSDDALAFLGQVPASLITPRSSSAVKERAFLMTKEYF